MHHETEVRLVEPHAERRGGDQRLDAVGQQISFELFAFGGFGGSGVGGHLEAPLTQQRRHIAGLRNGERVDDPRAGQRLEVGGQPRGALRGIARRAPPRAAATRRSSPPRMHQCVGPSYAQLSGDVGNHAIVGGGRGGQHGHVGAEVGKQSADATVVGAEVVTPVRYAVRFVDDDEAGVAGKRGKHLIAKVGVVQPFWADQEYIEFAALHTLMDVVPVGDVARVDGGGMDPGSLGRGDLVAHQRQQRRNNDGDTVPVGAQKFGRDEIHR